MIPYNAALNPPNTEPFTVEAWFFPASDQINGGQCPINNRYAYSGVNRQGWVFFQRAQDLSYSGASGYEGVGWDFRMYNENGSSGGLEITSGVPYVVGQWAHVVVVYDPVSVTNASLTMYINGVPAVTNVWGGGSDGTLPGYVANSNDHDASEAVNGPSAISFGAYNNTGLGGNPYFGAVDEFALYHAKLTADQILAHYQNGTNASRATPYDTLVQSANPVAYLRMDELAPGPDVTLNLGDLRSGGLFTNSVGVVHPGQSALAGRTDDGSYEGHLRNGGSTFVDIPWNANNNPDASLPFTFETWLRPTTDRLNPGPAPVNNRFKSSGNRTGWVIYQRDPDPSYAGTPQSSGEGVGWDFRMYTGSGSGGEDVVTQVPYTVGSWQHLVVTWEPSADQGPSTGGSEQWAGTLTAYVDGVAVNTNSTALYAANVSVTDDNSPPADLAVGSYNLASGGGEAFEGNIDELVIYTNYVLTADQILAHYQTATNSHPATNYEALVINAAYDGSGTQRTGPPTYLHFADPAFNSAANSGKLGGAADGILVLTANTVPGLPEGDVATPNSAVALDGTTSWVSLNNPAGLDFAGDISLEAWIKPSATQNGVARIISHGPPTPTIVDLTTTPDVVLSGALLSSNEVSLRIESGPTNYYVVGSFDGTNFHGVRFEVPAGDLGGSQWIHIVGTYDGTHWNLYRNGTQVATAADTVGAVKVDWAQWALGATGDGWSDYYTGSIDEAAIYNVALDPARVSAHYQAAQGASSNVQISVTQPNKVTITWTSGTLQSSTNVNGPYSEVHGATSPYPTTATGAAQFYRTSQ